jgi:hypothetical protein
MQGSLRPVQNIKLRTLHIYLQDIVQNIYVLDYLIYCDCWNYRRILSGYSVWQLSLNNVSERAIVAQIKGGQRTAIGAGRRYDHYIFRLI